MQVQVWPIKNEVWGASVSENVIEITRKHVLKLMVLRIRKS